MFRDREDAARQLALRFQGRRLQNPLVLGIPRGGVVVAAHLARELGAELDVVLSRKLRTPGAPELAMGSLGENGEVYANPSVRPLVEDVLFEQEVRRQRLELERRREVFRNARPAAELTGRTVIVVDDGIATGSTMVAALSVARQQAPAELIVATPVLAGDRLAEMEGLCDAVIYVVAPVWFHGVGQFYEDFIQVEDEEVLALLQENTGVLAKARADEREGI